MSDTCETCRFWDSVYHRDEQGLPDYIGACRIKSPMPKAGEMMKIKLGNWGIWPLTHRLDWCGEHEVKNG